MLLKVKPYKQKPRSCGPASLKIIFNYFGVQATESEIAKVSGWTFENGVNAGGLIRAAEKWGFKAFQKELCDFEDIRTYIKRRIPVLVDWFSVDDGHYSVVVGIDADKVYICDPQIGRMREFLYDDFKRVWFDFSGEWIKNKEDLVLRRVIVVKK